MRRIEEDILDIASKLSDGFTSRDMREFMSARGYRTDNNSIPAKLNELHGAGFLFFLTKKEGRFFRYYHHKYRDSFSLEERHDVPLSQDSWEEMADELAVGLLMVVQGFFTKEKALDVLNRYNTMKDSYNG